MDVKNPKRLDTREMGSSKHNRNSGMEDENQTKPKSGRKGKVIAETNIYSKEGEKAYLKGAT